MLAPNTALQRTRRQSLRSFLLAAELGIVRRLTLIPQGKATSSLVVPVQARIGLIAGAAGSFVIALLHVVIIALGAPGYLYFGAASLATLAEQGSSSPALITGALTLVFVIWGAYALSGAGVLAPFPLLRTVLAAIAFIYILRGLVLVPDLLRMAHGARYPVRQAVFSAASLVIGLSHAYGLLARGRPRSGV